MTNIIIICITLIIIICIICYTIIKIRCGNYRDIVLNDSTYQAAVTECNILSTKIKNIKEAANHANNTLQSTDIDVIVKLNIADYLINLIKNV